MRSNKVIKTLLLTLLLGGCSINVGPSGGVSTQSSKVDVSTSTSSTSEKINYSNLKIADLHLVNVEMNNIKVTGRVIGKNKNSFIVYDGTGKILFNNTDTTSVQVDDVVALFGNTSLYGDGEVKNQYFDGDNAKYAVVNEITKEFSELPTSWLTDNVEKYDGTIGAYFSLNIKLIKDNNDLVAEKLSSMSQNTIRVINPLDEYTKDYDFNNLQNTIITGFPIALNSNNEIEVIINSLEVKELSDGEEEKPLGKRIIDIYASNDIHGRVSENASENEPGIAKLATYLDNKKALNESGYIYINSGDYWQDTYESGYNKGKLLTECLDLMECETLALGNHEFDWGIDVIQENKSLVSYTKFLGANIRQYPDTSKTVDFADPYKIIERDGLKIGIIGAIGKDQITSITSSNWENITFLNHEDVVKSVSDELRVEKGCDIVILSIHADESVTGGNKITAVSPLSNKKYVDAVFCAHSHQREITYYNNVPFIQAGDHGANLSHVQLQYENGEVKALEAEYEGYGLMKNLEPDQEIKKVIDKYFDNEFITQKNKIHGTIQGDYSINSRTAGNLLAKATYDLLKKNNIDCDIVINNGSRDTVTSGEMSSEKIFNMMPFTNKTLVVKNIKGEDIIGECVEYSNPYYMPNASLKIEENKYYTVACIDYVMLHKSSNRRYNYFPSYNASNLIYTIEDYPNVIIEKHLQENKIVNTSSYKTSNFNCL